MFRVLIKVPYWIQKGLQFLSPKKNWSVYGAWFSSNWGDRTFRYYLKGAYGFSYSTHLKKLDIPFVFLDIGTNQGLYSLLAIKNPNCQVAYAFEPVKSIFHLLQKNILLNKAENKIKGLNFGISETSGVGEITYDPAHTGKSSLSSHGVGIKHEVEVLNYDSLNAFLEIPHDSQIICKVDVEGLEEIVIAQLLATGFSSKIIEIMFEVHEDWLDLNKLKGLLVRNGFVTFEQIGEGNHYDLIAKRCNV